MKDSKTTQDRFAKKAYSAPVTDVHRLEEQPVKSFKRECKDVVFIEAYAR